MAVCKWTRALMRMRGSGGTALPGKAAMLFAKNILEVVSDGMEVIVVTGTNGKTTTCRMLENAFKEAGIPCLANRSGANLLSGVTAELTCNADWLGRPRTRCAVIECDEGALKQVAPLLHPKVITVTNLFRDQLDRYGEVMHTADAIRKGIALSPESILCLNADDSLVSSLAFDVPNEVRYYGFETPVGEQNGNILSDAKYCIRCGKEYQYHYRTYAHLGDFYCAGCGYTRQKPGVSVTGIVSGDSSGSHVRMRARGEEKDVQISLPAVYNIYNAAATVCTCEAFGLPEEPVIRSLSTVRSGFGRMETFTLTRSLPQEEGRQEPKGISSADREFTCQMILVKNPAGCNQSIEYLKSITGDFTAVFGLNDRTADGHDISWIWDVDYEKLSESTNIRAFLVTGDRAEDMQMRLKYAGIPKEKIEIEHDAEKLLDRIRQEGRDTYIIPNYTAMLSLRKVISEATGARAFWEG